MTNFVFSRRSLQTAINELSDVLQEKQLTSLVAKLNKMHDGRLAAMWEVVLLSALAKVGVLTHEAPLPNGRRPDFSLQLDAGTANEASIVGDIATISDVGRNEQNPVDELAEQLIKLAEKAHLLPERIGFKVGHQQDSAGQVTLALPKKRDIARLLKLEILPWMRQCANFPDVPATFDYRRGVVNFSLTYQPNQRSFTGGYLSYTGVTSLNRNTLAYTLKCKAGQLRASSATAGRMVIACDGGTDLFNVTAGARSIGNHTAHDVAQDFLRQNSSIDLVLLIKVEQPGLHLSTPCNIACALVMRPTTSQSSRIAQLGLDRLTVLLAKFLEYLPKPVRAPYNASLLCNDSAIGPCPFGGYEMSSDRIRMSVRALQRLLAGDVTSDEFHDRHGWGGSEGFAPNPFRQLSCEGRLIVRVEVEPGGDRDDDSITFWFGPPDPAASPFRVPKNSSKEN